MVVYYLNYYLDIPFTNGKYTCGRHVFDELKASSIQCDNGIYSK